MIKSHRDESKCIWGQVIFKKITLVQWLRIRLPMQGGWAWSLVWEDPTCHVATKPGCHNYWCPCVLGPVLCNKRSRRNETHVHQNKQEPPLAATREKPECYSESPVQPKRRNKRLCQYSLLFRFHVVKDQGILRIQKELINHLYEKASVYPTLRLFFHIVFWNLGSSTSFKIRIQPHFLSWWWQNREGAQVFGKEGKKNRNET